MPTRWRDNDIYAHMNNVVFYELLDSAVNGWLLRAGYLSLSGGTPIGFVVASGCKYLAPLGFPEPVDVGLRVARIGTSSVRYEAGLFAPGGDEAAAEMHLTHVYVDRETRRPTPLAPAMRAGLGALVIAPAGAS